MMIMAKHPQNQSQRHEPVGYEINQQQKQFQQHYHKAGCNLALEPNMTATADLSRVTIPSHAVELNFTNADPIVDKAISNIGRARYDHRPSGKDLLIDGIENNPNMYREANHLSRDNSEKHIQDSKRALIRNQLCLIEQLQLENVNLRNERDQLQLENEELKFQLQMIR